MSPIRRIRLCRLAGLAFLFVSLNAMELASVPLAWGFSSDAENRIRASGIVSENVIEGLRSTDFVRVIIAFQSPGAETERARGKILSGDRAQVAATSKSILASLEPGQFELRHRFETIGALAGKVTADGVVSLTDHPAVLRVDIDAPGSGNLLQALPLMNLADPGGLGLTGMGVTVAVLDSGYDSDHVDLSDDLEGEACFCSGGGGCCPAGGTTESGPGAAEDDHGHGTNVTGIITSNGVVAPMGGARAAKIVAVKVLDDDNRFCCSSDVVAGLDYIINNHPEVDIVNMSLGTNARFPGDCDTATGFTMAFAAAIDTLRTNGVITFVSTGNNGSGTDMQAPACVANAISVGAVWDTPVGSPTVLGCTESGTAANQVTCFSNSSATTDVFAPGAWMKSTGMGGGTSTYAGTSQASPATAACAAVLLEDNPARGPARLEAALEASSTLVTDTTNGLTFPRVDCEAALVYLKLCGNESIDPGEECDEGIGNGGGRSCCDGDCQLKPNGEASCDGSLCTRPDSCSNGICTPGPCAIGEKCSICGGVCTSDGACSCLY